MSLLRILPADPSLPAWPPAARSLPHVLLVLDQFPRTLGGGERVVLRLAELLPQYGFRASVLTFFMHPESSARSATLPFPVYLLPLQRTYDLAAFRGAWELGAFLRTERVCLVQTHFESSDLWAGLVTKALSGAKLVWSRRDMGILRGRKHQTAYGRLSRLPDHVLAVSDQVRQHCIDTDRVKPTRATTVYNGLDLALWPAAKGEPAGFRSEAPVITTVGNIRPVKGHDILLQAAALVLQQVPQAHFTVAGEVLDTAYMGELKHLQAELGLGDRFCFLGGATDLPAHLATADVFVLPSRSEGFSNAILEAMAAGLPVVATEVGGNAEAVQDQITGLVIPAGNPQALADAILMLVRKPESARAMGAAGRTRVEEQFSNEAMMQKIAHIYRQALG